jgi:hypothetical protein
MEHTGRKRFSMIRSFHFADLLTIANGCCGVGSVFHAMRYLAPDSASHMVVAVALVPLALVFDILDGYVARLSRNANPSLAPISIRSPMSFRLAWVRPCSAIPLACAAGGTWSV